MVVSTETKNKIEKLVLCFLVVIQKKVRYGSHTIPKDQWEEISLAYTDDTIVDLLELDEDTTYVVQIIPELKSSSLTPQTVTFHTRLGPPRHLSVEYVTNNEVQLTWEEASSTVQNYRVRYFKDSLLGFAPVVPGFAEENFDEETQEVHVSGLTATISGLESDTSYSIEVSAKQNYGEHFTEPASTSIHTQPDPIIGLQES